MGPNAQVCTSCGEKGTFRGEVCRPCRRKALTDESDFTENTVRTSLLLQHAWSVSNGWRFVYVSAGVCALWLSRDVAVHNEYLALPMAALAISFGNQVMQTRRYYIPRSLQALSGATLRLGVHAQMMAFTVVMGIATACVVQRVGYGAYLRNPLNVTQNFEAVRAREAADGFTQRAPALKQELATIEGLVEKSDLTTAETRLGAVEDELKPVLQSYVKGSADAVALKKMVAAVHEHISARRQALAVNEAMGQMDVLNHRIDQIDHELSRSRWDLASHLWVKVKQEIEDVPNPADALSHAIELAKNRLDKQRELIKRGFTHQPGQGAVAKHNEAPKKHGTRAMASVDP